MKKWSCDILRIGFLGACMCLASPLGFSADAKNTDLSANWHKVASKQGNCTVKFPSSAERVSEKMKIDEVTEMQYEAYVSASNEDTVFMMLVAQYPDFVDEDFAQMSLEAFLNGILSHGAEAQLLFADLVLVQGYEGLDFFIRTGPNFFKGRVLMVKSQLYLLAMECKVSEYDEKGYEAFVNSFLLGH
mgnify:CR=1 FL=1|jgi:hypothetical protein